VTRTDWLSDARTQPPEVALDILRPTRPGLVSARKLRLFACACCRRAWALLPKAARKAVEAAERYADGAATLKELRTAERRAADRAAANAVARPAVAYAARAASNAARFPVSASCHDVCYCARRALEVAGRKLEAETRAQGRLLADVFGDPFRRSEIDRAWLAWNDGCVRRIAHGIYAGRAFGDMPLLHDALLDAGCDDEDLLEHCRGEGPHVRGCWALDLLLGKM
jgi:hypothetical protein